METIFSFFVRSMLVSAVLYSYYALFLKDRKLNRLNRIYLLSVFPVSLILPAMNFSRLQWHIPETISGTVVSAGANGQTLAKVFLILAFCYLTVSGVLLLGITWKMYRLFRLKQRSNRQLIDGFWLVETGDPRAPFTFFDNLFWRQGDDLVTTDNAKIIDHELVHIRQRHSYDRLFGQFCCGVCWINPFFWKIQRELATIHEFLADEGAFELGDTETFAKMILRNYHRANFPGPDLGFGKSDIERRIGMVSRPPERHSPWKKGLMATSLVIFLGLSMASISYTPDLSSSGGQLSSEDQHSSVDLPSSGDLPSSADRLNASDGLRSAAEASEREQKLKDERNHRTNRGE